MNNIYQYLTLLLCVLISGCAIATEGFPRVDIHGQIMSKDKKIKSHEVSIKNCINDSSQTIKSDDTGLFMHKTGYVHGGCLMIIPPLGNIPGKTPPPPDMCINFPDFPGEFYRLEFKRNEVVWAIYDEETNIKKEKSSILPTLLDAKIEEYNAKGESMNDWLLKLVFEERSESNPSTFRRK